MSGGGCEAKSLCPNAQTKTHVSISLQSEGSEVLELLRMWEHCLPVLGLQEVDRVRVCGAGLARAQPVRIEDV